MGSKGKRRRPEKLVPEAPVGSAVPEALPGAQAELLGDETTAEAAAEATVTAEPSTTAELAEPAELAANLPETAESLAQADFKAKTTLSQEAFRKTFDWVKDQKVLLDAFLVALSFHVVMLPVLWAAGWALPWPKPPVVTTIIEFDLDQWMKNGKPKKVIEFRDPELNQ